MGVWGVYPDENDGVADGYLEMLENNLRFKGEIKADEGFGIADSLGYRAGNIRFTILTTDDYPWLFNYLTDQALKEEVETAHARAEYTLGLLLSAIRNLTKMDYGIFQEDEFKVYPPQFPQYLRELALLLLEHLDPQGILEFSEENREKRRQAENLLSIYFSHPAEGDISPEQRGKWNQVQSRLADLPPYVAPDDEADEESEENELSDEK